MGLAISVGILADLMKNDAEGARFFIKQFQLLNEVLRENNLPEHHEPETLAKLHLPESFGSFPYSFLHYLRRVAAYSFRDKNWVAEDFPSNEDPTEDDVLDSEMMMFESHLLCHSDCEGFYVPVDFSEVIFDDPKGKRILGGMLGSSHQLMKEIVQIAPSLEINLIDGKLSDADAEKLNSIEDGDKLFREKIVWLTLFEASRLSIKHKTAIVFH
jgi:hypothetical protein